jgi:hypothetical protein
LGNLASFLEKCIRELPIESLFAAYDLFRAITIDARVCGFFAEKTRSSIILKLLHYVNSMKAEAPYNLRLITTQLACNLVVDHTSSSFLLRQSEIIEEMKELVSFGLLDSGDRPNLQVVASCLAFNIAAVNHRHRLDKNEELLSTDYQVDLFAPLVETLSQESTSGELLTRILLALGLFIHLTPVDEDVWQLAHSYELPSMIEPKKKQLADVEAVKDAVKLLETLK